MARDEHTEVANTAMEKVKSHPSKGAKSSNVSSQKKRPKYQTAVLRRSDRIQNIIRPATASNQEIEPVIEDITLSDSDQEDDQEDGGEDDQEDGGEDDQLDKKHADMEEELQEPLLCPKTMEEKMDYLVQLLESLGTTVESLNFKVIIPRNFTICTFLFPPCLFY